MLFLLKIPVDQSSQSKTKDSLRTGIFIYLIYLSFYLFTFCDL